MKIFDYKNTPKLLLTPDIVAMLASIHEHKGKQELYIEAHSDATLIRRSFFGVLNSYNNIMERGKIKNGTN